MPPSAGAVSTNVTVTGADDGGTLRLVAAESLVSSVSTINYAANQTRGNYAIVGLCAGASRLVAEDSDDWRARYRGSWNSTRTGSHTLTGTPSFVAGR
jgi:hypothetical protein